jgi:hypothetical protein
MGCCFLPQVLLAILASSLGPALARRWTLKRVLLAGLSADLLAMTLLTLSRPKQDFPRAAYGILLVATGSLGFGFGAAVMALNTYAEKLSPGREDRAVLVLNALLGASGCHRCKPAAPSALFIVERAAGRIGWMLWGRDLHAQTRDDYAAG